LANEEWDSIENCHEDNFEMLLYLTPQQIEVLNHPLPLLISGTAGSGKTTIGIYYLLKLPLAKEKKLYITYNRYLKNTAQRLYQGLLNAIASQAEYLPPDFFTFKEYCLQVAAAHQKIFAPELEINLDRFSKLIQSSSFPQKYDVPLIWEEIRSIIKGALPQLNLNVFEQALARLGSGQITLEQSQNLRQQFQILANLESMQKINEFTKKYLEADLNTLVKNFPYYLEHQHEHFLTTLERIIKFLQREREITRKKYLSFMDYEALGKKKAPNFRLDRKGIYQIFEWYQDRLEREHGWDELDLTREVMHLLTTRDARAHQYDLVICDEVQDLTDVQHELLFHISHDPLKLLLSGDTKQIINPSGFRWEELKRHFYEKGLKVPEIHFLNLNFRSSGSIVELSNTLLALKTQLLGVTAEESLEDWKFKGRPAVVIQKLSDERIFENVQRMGARQTILVRTQAEKTRLSEILATELIFTISEAKGLEFDTVLLWKFAADLTTRDIWEVILKESSREIHQAQIKHEINLLYVAITRAQKDLLIYDGKTPASIWQNTLIKDKVFFTDDPEFIGNIWNVISTPEEWSEQGAYFFEREYYRAAMECFKNAGHETLFLKAQAFDAEKRQDYELAARNFDRLQDPKNAAINYERSANYQRALALWEELKQLKRAFECKLKLLEQSGNYRELAGLYLQLKNYPRAFECSVRAELYDQAAELSLKRLKNKKNACLYFEKAGRYEEAAKLQKQAKNFEKAAELYEKAKNFPGAELLWKRLKRYDRLEHIYQLTKNNDELLKFYEKQHDFERAVQALKNRSQNTDLLQEAETLFDRREYFPALIRFYVMNFQPGLAKTYFALKSYPEAGRLYALSGDHYQAGFALKKSQKYLQAFEQFLLSPEDQNNHYPEANRLINKLTIQEIQPLAHKLRTQKKYELARFCFQAISDNVHSGICYLEMNKPEMALASWGITYWNNNEMREIAQYCLEHNYIEYGAAYLLQQPIRGYFHVNHAYTHNQFIQSPAAHTLMDTYFKTQTDRAKISRWINILESEFPTLAIVHKIFFYFERITDYNLYFYYIDHLKRTQKPLFQALKNEFIKETTQLGHANSESAAIKFYYIGKMTEFNRIVRNLTPSETNIELFMASKYQERIIDILLLQGDIERVRWILIQSRQFLRLAEILEKSGDLSSAAHYYKLAGKHDRSATIYTKLGKLVLAGDAYFEAKLYPKALELYLKDGKKEQKIANTYEKIGQYEKAIVIWKKLGKQKNIERCLKRMGGLPLFDQLSRKKRGSI
ncbi:UvrD-helicase domain-containing protein, partial [candidate division KSB1 bacterium]|nr:UvrD-helicase domain-containing protein [candidate division KSB1 bacterium]